MRLLTLFVLCVLLVPAARADDLMDREIDHLLDAVGSSSCIFVRNGKEYGPEAAKDHLSMKRHRGKKYFSSTEEFIDRLASSSSWTGKPYFIQCGDGGRQLAAEWFADVLRTYRGER